MSQIIKKFIGNDQVGSAKLLLENNSALRGANAAGTAVDMFKISTADAMLQLQSMLPSSDNSLDLGSGSARYATAYVQDLKKVETVNNDAGDIQMTAGNVILGAATAVAIAPFSGAAKPLSFRNGANTYGVSFQASDALAVDVAYTWPASAPTNNYVLKSDGSGVLAWSDVASLGDFANKTLSNLTSPTAVNQDIVPDGASPRDLGSSSIAFAEGYINELKKVSSIGNDAGNINVSGNNVQLAAPTSVSVMGVSGSEIPLRLNSGDNAYYVGFIPPSGLSASTQYQLPAADGTSGQYLKTNGSAVLSWASLPSAAIWDRESITLAAGDITNGYVDLAHQAVSDSIIFFVDGVMMRFGVDYTVSVVGGVTRLDFSTSVPPMASGDVLYIQYQY